MISRETCSRNTCDRSLLQPVKYRLHPCQYLPSLIAFVIIQEIWLRNKTKMIVILKYFYVLRLLPTLLFNTTTLLPAKNKLCYKEPSLVQKKIKLGYGGHIFYTEVCSLLLCVLILDLSTLTL
jgi:hypothetical protein